MDISLRKAHKIQLDIHAKVQSLKIPSVISISIFESAESAILKAKEEAKENYNRRISLYKELTLIRANVATINTKRVTINDDEVSVSDILAAISSTEKAISMTEDLVNCIRPTCNLAAVKRQLNKLRDSEELHTENIQLYIYDDTDKDVFKDQLYILKKKKNELQDILIDLNSELKITLSENSVKVLTEEKIL